MSRKNYRWLYAAFGMLVLILDSRNAIEAAKEAVLLCTQTLIPSLFPFFVFSSLLTGSLSGTTSKLLSPLEQLFRIPSGSGSLPVIGFLGGYPTGAQCIRQAYEAGQLSRKDAIRMTAFCNNAGPSFLFGIVAPFFPEHKYIWILWLIHMLSALSVSACIPSTCTETDISKKISSITVTVALERSVRVMASVCGWVMMFRIVLSYLNRWILIFFPVPIQILLTGLTELTNGCLLLGQINSISGRFLIASVLLGFGGGCVMLQTKSVLRDFPLSPFFQGKLIQAAFSFLYGLNWLVFAEAALHISPVLIFTLDIAAGSLVFLIPRRMKNIVAFPDKMLYNRSNVLE